MAQFVKKCLLIGGSGFIGVHLTRKLIAIGRSVTVLDLKAPSEHYRIANVSYLEGCFSNYELISELIATHDEVVHLADVSRANTLVSDPMVEFVKNMPSSLQLFDLAARFGVRLILVSSGGTVYGEANSTPIKETHNTLPISIYGVNKLVMENYATFYAMTKDLDLIIARPSNPYGEGQLPFTGQGFIATALGTALRGDVITIFGRTGTVRDYIYVGDLVDGIALLLQEGKSNQIYNIGSGIGLSNLQIIDACRILFSELADEIRVCHAPDRLTDVKINILDSTKLNELGWCPSVDLKDGLRKTLDWLNKRTVDDL